MLTANEGIGCNGKTGSAVKPDERQDIAIEARGALGLITLTREAALNALTHSMVRQISAALDAWEQDDNIRHIAIRGRGRAFSAGGDLLDLYNSGRAGTPNYSFFQDEYRLNARLGVFPKPIVALINGIVMGGGGGVAVHGRYRVMTENAVFSMPEVGIGFFPDVGGSYFLPRLPNRTGHYLGLTGARIRSGDAHSVGIATHIVPADNLAELTTALTREADTGAVLARFHAPHIAPDAVLDQNEINRLFGAESLPGVLSALEAARARSDLAASSIKAIARNSPTSVAVAFRQIRDGAKMTLADCMRMEYRILVRMLQGRDFYEGIRAVIVDKTNDPRWQPDGLGGLEEAAIDAFFAPLGAEELAGVPEQP